MRVLKKRKLIHRAWGSETEVHLYVETYPNGRIGLQLMCPMEFDPEELQGLTESERKDAEEMLEPYMTCSVNLPDEPCPSNEVFIKDYSENAGITGYLVSWGVLESEEPTHMANSGFVVIGRHRLSASFMMELAAALTKGKSVGNAR